MKKEIIPILLLFTAPIWIVILGFVALQLYLFAVEPIYQEIKHIGNIKQNCERRAEELKIRVADVIFKIPADDFQRNSLMQCWGSGMFGSYRGCTKFHQYKKDFQHSEEIATKGFCQSDWLPAFRLKRLELKAQSYIEDETENFSGRITFDEISKSGLKRYCKYNDKNAKIFENPAFFSCRKNKYKEGLINCSYTGLMGSKIKIRGFVSFEKDAVSEEDKQNYIDEVEAYIHKLVLNIPKANYDKTCENALRWDNHGR